MSLCRSYRHIVISCQRRKYVVAISLCLFIIVWIIRRDLRSIKSVDLKYVTVHLDLKGSPPKMSYLESILPTLSMYGANSILMEYEDMFPYSGSIANISSVNAYSEDELKQFINKAKLHNIEIIPLIQTFGHMEFVLKLKEFAHLREHKRSYNNICPSNPSSITLITTMLKQVIDLHTTIQPLKHIHLGCDEVFKINLCRICRKRRLGTTALFSKHVEKLSSIVKELSPGTKVLIWGDMIHYFEKTPQTIYFNKNTQRKAFDNVDVVSWNYRAYPYFYHPYYYSLHTIFKDIWIASAFKGADGENAAFPDIRVRFNNHLGWIRFILDYKFGGESEVYNFKGIILTGWSRFSHLQPQCELLPLAMPSLLLNLLLIRKVKEGVDYSDLKNMDDCEFYNKYLSLEYNKIYPSYNKSSQECSFENTFIFEELAKLFDRTLLQNCELNLYQTALKCTESGYVNLTDSDNIFATCERALNKLFPLKEYLESFMIKYYETHVIKSYVHDTVKIPTEKVNIVLDNLKECMNTNKKYKNVDFV